VTFGAKEEAFHQQIISGQGKQAATDKYIERQTRRGNAASFEQSSLQRREVEVCVP